MSTQKKMYSSTITIDYYRMHLSKSTITLEHIHDYFHYFNYYPFSNTKTTFMESLGIILFLLLFHYLVFQLITVIHYPGVIIINNQMTFSGIE